jgi:hypothetical protein
MPPRKSASRNLTFVDRHDLWPAEQRRAATAVEREIKRRKLEVVRFAFVDQHGVLRGKTLVADEAARAMRAGVTMTSTLLAKDTSHRTVFPVFAAGGGMGLDEMAGAGNFVMVADPSTFRVLPWANATGWLLCDIYFPNGKPVPLSTRALYRDALSRLGATGFHYFAGLEVEFQLFKVVDPQLATETLTWPAEAPLVSHTTQGFQYLTEQRFDQVDPILEVLRKTMQALELPLRSLEVELAGRHGASRYHGAVPQRAQAGGAAARPSREPDVPAAAAEHVRQRLAPASVAARRQIQAEPVRLQRSGGTAFAARPLISRRPHRARARGGRLHHADHQWLQALPALFAGARSRHLGAR